MKAKVYIETSIVSYLTARPSRDVIVAAHQQITDEWWTTKRSSYDIYISQLVMQEAEAGNEEMAQRRVAALEEIEWLELTEDVFTLADDLINQGPLPAKAFEDAVHIATAVVNGMNYLITWNCKHIANAKMRNKIAQICRDNGYEPIIICTPEELLED